MSEKKEYKYYAFISYSRKNSPAANYLQKELERSKIPSAKVDESLLPQDGKYLKPVFLDKRDLEVTEKDFSENIQHAIENSRYLLVLCSPESAQSEWVGREISYFLETHENNINAIVPIILSGNPGSGDDQECLPEVLRREDIQRRNLPRMIPEKGETEEQGWENGMVQAMSYMLRVNRESIKATIDAERIRIYRNYAAIFLVALLISAALTVWALLAEKRADRNAALANRNEQTANRNANAAKAQAERADKNAIEAKQQSDIAKKNEAEAKRQAGIAKKNEAEAKRQEEIAKKNEAEAKRQEGIAKKNEAEAKRQAGIAKKNESEAKRQAGIAKKNEAEAKRQAGIAKKNESEAKRQAEIAKSSLEFLRDVFASSDPTQLGNKDIKVIDAIKAKIPEINKIKEWQLKASVALTVGSILNNLGKQKEALELLKISEALYEKYARESSEMAMCYNVLGVAYAACADHRSALKYHKKALAIQERFFNDKHADIFQSYTNLASTYSFSGNYQLALEYYEKAFKISKKLPANHSYLYQYYNNIGGLYLKLGDDKKALEYFKNALSNATSDSDKAVTKNNIGFIYCRRKEYLVAWTYIKEASDIRKKIFPENHPEIALSYINEGAFYSLLGHKLALDHFRKALDIFNLYPDTQQANIAICYTNLGFEYRRLGIAYLAQDYYKKSLDIYIKILPPTHPTLAMAYNNLGVAYLSGFQNQKALDCCEKALNILKEFYHEDHPQLANSYCNTGQVYFRKGEYRNAYNHINKAYEIFRSKLGDNHPTTQQVLDDLKFVEQKLKESGQ